MTKRAIGLATALAALTLALSPVLAAPASAATGPAIIKKPVILGNVAIGSTLKVDRGVWSVKPSTYSYKWYRCSSAPKPFGTFKPAFCTLVAGATKRTYAITGADTGSFLAVRISATTKVGVKAVYVSRSISVAAPIPVDAPPTLASAPVLTLDTSAGFVASVTNGNWIGSPTSFNYQWFGCVAPVTSSEANTPVGCIALNAPSQASYAPGPDAIGLYVVGAVFATNDYGVTGAWSTSTVTAFNG